jgi:hypothetical protein
MYADANPLRYRDPSGHEPCFEDGYCVEDSYSSVEHLKYLARLYGIRFTGSWTEENKWAVIAGVQAVGDAFAHAIGSVSSALTFRDVFGVKTGNYKEKFNFEWGCSTCTAFGLTEGTRHVRFRDMYDNVFQDTTLVVHELFHALENAMEITLEDGTKYKEARSTLPSHFTREGLTIDPPWTWQQSDDNGSGEIFADMGIAWVYGQWNTESPRFLADQMSNWMKNRMPHFLDVVLANQR